MTPANLIEIFCILDEFCKFFAPELKKHTIQVPGKSHRNRPSRMSDSEIMTILILFHTHRFRDLKSFYLGYVCQHMRKDFPNPVSYTRFVERQALWGFTCCSSFRPAPSASARAYPSSTPRPWYPATSSGRSSTRP